MIKCLEVEGSEKWGVKWSEELGWIVCTVMDLQFCSLYVGYCTVCLAYVSLFRCYLLYVFCSFVCCN